MRINIVNSDIAPRQGRHCLDKVMDSGDVVWMGTDFSLFGDIHSVRSEKPCLMKVQGKLLAQDEAMPRPGWIELETFPGDEEPTVEDLYLVGTRPLPGEDIICICRHPSSAAYILAVSAAGELLWLDSHILANLKIICRQPLPRPLVALICCGTNLLGLQPVSPSVCMLHLIAIDGSPSPSGHLQLIQTLEVPFDLIALAEDDHSSAWGISAGGELYRLSLADKAWQERMEFAQKHGRLATRSWVASISNVVKELCQAARVRSFSWSQLRFKTGKCSGFAYDGRHFWSFSRDSKQLLRLHEPNGTLIRTFRCHAAVSICSLSYCHNNLLILDRDHRRLHLYHLADTMQPTAAFQPATLCHPGYLPAGGPRTAGMHEMCMLYVGAEGSQNIHRYDRDKLLPLLGYLSPQGEIKDYFMDGFLMLAQYSPLLNGRSFALDLPGAPSRREDWLALVDEYFHPQANLVAMDQCLEELRLRLGPGSSGIAKVVCAIPTADPRCLNWDNAGYSLAEEHHRLEVTRWAMQEVVKRWHQAGFRHLRLAGFFYMTEQGLYDDRVLHNFPDMCTGFGLRSFAIPGITSSWITEFNRAGFDAVTLQPSHSFSQPPMRPWYHLLKSAGRIAREYGMGIEVELPYAVLEPDGRQKLRDYLHMAAIQGWAGAFTAYFQSYNLIKSLCESQVPECRQLYDELFQFTRLSRQRMAPDILTNKSVAFNCQASFDCSAHNTMYRLNVEGHRGRFHLQKLSISARP